MQTMGKIFSKTITNDTLDEIDGMEKEIDYGKEKEFENEATIHAEKSLGYFTIKRAIDIVGSSVGIILLSPVFLITAIVIKFDSKGPVFFAHKRLGKCENTINIYKFRTMLPNAEELLKKLNAEQKKEFGINFKLKNDPRITNIGHFLRKSSLDELPQLFNILYGNLSIVGPRPIIKKELDYYGIYKDKRMGVKPGLTGLWQVRGRNDTTYEERVKFDMTYVNNRSLILDIRIILKTFIVVFKGNGAC